MARKKYVIEVIEINAMERYRRFELKLPANVKKVTGVIITTSVKDLGG